MKPLFTGLILLLLMLSVRADEKAVQKYRNYTPQQVAAMPEKVRSSEMPVIYIWAAQKGMGKGAELVFSMELNKLMYPGLADYRRAVMDFQRDLGDAPNGTLTVWQIHQLTKRSEMQALGSISFHNTYSSFKGSDYGKVQGTMMIHEDRIAWPINHHIVHCYRQQAYCEVEQIALSIPDDNSFAQSYGVMRLDPDQYDITKWEADTIEATTSSNSGCRQTTVTLNFKAKEFYFITRNGVKDCEVLGAQVPRLAKPRIAQIVDGAKIIRDEFANVQRAAFKVTSKSFQARVETLLAQERAVR
jgi:hypothetical protein